MPTTSTCTRIAGAKVALWIETEDGRGSLAIFEPFDGTVELDFDLAEHVGPSGWVETERIPGGRIAIEGRYRLVHTASHVEPPALPPEALPAAAATTAETAAAPVHIRGTGH